MAAEVTLAVDPSEAASIWRAEKLRDFVWRARCAGIDGDPEVARLIEDLRAHTSSLEEMRAAESIGTKPRKWWSDGEYDAVRADLSNDLGMGSYREGQFEAAFDHYTEAIRLAPHKAVYHANRAATGLKLGRYTAVIEDGLHAIERDPAASKNHMRVAKAHMALRHYGEAAESFSRALESDAASAAARKGYDEASTMAKAQARAAAEEGARALRGDRPELSISGISEEDAAQSLLSAEAMLQASPSLEAAKCQLVEALIACRRYRDALERVTGLQAGVDMLYLRGEALWRMGRLAEAEACLDSALEAQPGSTKCERLRGHVRGIARHVREAEEAEEVEAFQDVIDSCTSALDARGEAAGDSALQCSGLHAAVLCTRGGACAARGLLEDARADLDRALELEPECSQALEARSALHRRAGRLHDCMLDLIHLQDMKPGDAKSYQMLREVAACCLGGGAGGGSGGGGSSGAASHDQARGARLATLGLGRAATSKEIGTAYRKLAGQWHPDKWATRSAEEQAVAAETFGRIKEAYEDLAAGR